MISIIIIIALTQYGMHNIVLECISCTFAVPVSLICDQLFGVKM